MDQAFTDLAVKHLDMLLTAAVPIVIAALAARVKVQQRYVRAVVEQTELECARSTNPRVDNQVLHHHAVELTKRLPLHVRPLLSSERNMLIKSSVKNMKRASMAPKEPSK